MTHSGFVRNPDFTYPLSIAPLSGIMIMTRFGVREFYCGNIQE